MFSKKHQIIFQPVIFCIIGQYDVYLFEKSDFFTEIYRIMLSFAAEGNKYKEMNVKFLLFAIVPFMLLNSCKKVDKLTQFTMDFDQQVIIEAPVPIPIGVLPNIPTPAISTNSDSVFENENTHKDLVEEAILEELSLHVVDPDGATFSFLESIEVYMSAEGLDEVLIAFNNQVPPEAYIELEPVGQDLKEYIKKDEIVLSVKVVTDEIILQDHTIDIHTEFYIDAKILGI